MFNNDSYIRKFPIYECSLLVDLKDSRTDGHMVETDDREDIVSWFKRVFMSK